VSDATRTRALPPLPALAELKIGRPRGARDVPWDLLVDADPDRAHIEGYLDFAWTRVMWHEGVALGVYVLARRDETRFEIKNLAVDARYRGRGIGRWLLGHAIGLAESKGGRVIVVGADRAGPAALALLRRAGFRNHQVSFVLILEPE
jgi:ribosomal protein S18 acetylase RimI-like enzyme